MPVVPTGPPTTVTGPPLQIGTGGRVVPLWQQILDVRNDIQNLQQEMQVSFRDQGPSMMQQVMNIQQKTAAAQSTLQQLLVQYSQTVIVDSTLAQAANAANSMLSLTISPTVSSSTIPSKVSKNGVGEHVESDPIVSTTDDFSKMANKRSMTYKASKNDPGEHVKSGLIVPTIVDLRKMGNNHSRTTKALKNDVGERIELESDPIVSTTDDFSKLGNKHSRTFKASKNDVDEHIESGLIVSTTRKMGNKRSMTSAASENDVGEHVGSAERSQTPASANVPLLETAVAAKPKQARAPSPSTMFDEDSVEATIPQTPQPEAVPGNVILQAPHLDLTTPMNVPQTPTAQPDPELAILANMPQTPETAIRPRAALLANILVNMSESHQRSVTPTSQLAEREVESPPVVLEPTMAQLFPGLPSYKPIDISLEDLNINVEDLMPFPEELQQMLRQHEPVIDNKGGRPSSQTLKIVDDQLAELDKQLAQLSKATGISVASIMKRWNTTKSRGGSLWNVYQRYFTAHKDDELARLGLNPSTVVTGKIRAESYVAFRNAYPATWPEILEVWAQYTEVQNPYKTVQQRTLQFRQVWRTVCNLVCPLSPLQTSN